jgi:hypothetical protein
LAGDEKLPGSDFSALLRAVNHSLPGKWDLAWKWDLTRKRDRTRELTRREAALTMNRDQVCADLLVPKHPPYDLDEITDSEESQCGPTSSTRTGSPSAVLDLPSYLRLRV